MNDPYYDPEQENRLRQAKTIIESLMSASDQDREEERGEEAASRWGQRDYRHYAEEPAAMEKAEARMVRELAEHLEEKNDIGRRTNKGSIVVENAEEAKKINEKVREHLQMLGGLDTKEKTVTWDERKLWTPAEKSNPEMYSDVDRRMEVRFTRDVDKFREGERAQIIGPSPKIEGNGKDVLLRCDNQTIGELPLDRADSFEIFERQSLTVAKGEQLRIDRDSTHVRNTSSYSYLSGGRDHRLDRVEFRQNEISRVDGMVPDTTDVNMGAKEALLGRGEFSYAYAITPDQLPDHKLGKVFLASEKLRDDDRLKAYAEKYPDAIQESNMPDREREAGFSKPERHEHLKRESEPKTVSLSQEEKDYSYLDCPDHLREHLRPPFEQDRDDERDRDGPEMEI